MGLCLSLFSFKDFPVKRLAGSNSANLKILKSCLHFSPAPITFAANNYTMLLNNLSFKTNMRPLGKQWGSYASRIHFSS
jgi:hypothetical protein